MVVEALQHEAVAAQGDDDLRIFQAAIAIEGDKFIPSFLSFGAVAGAKGEAGRVRHDHLCL